MIDRFVPDLWNWELPGGLLDEGEEPAAAAAGEIEEETGYRPRNIEHLVTFEHEWPDVLDRTRSLVDGALGTRETAATPAWSRS